MNFFIGVGRLTKDFETSSTGKSAWSTVAIDRRKKDQDGNKVTDFIPIRVLGETSVKTVTKWLGKGTKIAFEGELQFSSYQDSEGNKKTQTYVVISNWEFAESKNASAPAAQTSNSPITVDGFLNLPDTDLAGLPFK